VDEERITKMITVLYILLVITLSFLPSIEPFYTITNTDQYAHEVTTNISSYKDEYSWQAYYQLGPGESVEIRKPVSLMVKWINPFRETEIFYSSSDYTYMVASEGYQHIASIQPGFSTSMSFELHNESGENPIKLTKTRF
jgi:hypothetical protein